MTEPESEEGAASELLGENEGQLTYQIREQVLPKESWLDVMNFVDRPTLDGGNVVSRRFNANTQSAEPLREIFNVEFWCRNGLFELLVRSRNGRTVLVRQSEWKGMEQMFLACMRFSSVSGEMRIRNIPIGRALVDGLKEIAPDFRCNDEHIGLTDVTLTDGISPLDFLTALPSFRTITGNTQRFIGATTGLSDDLLKSLPSRGIHRIDSARHRDITEDGLIGFAFAAADDGGQNERVVHIGCSAYTTTQFLKKLVEAFRACQSGHRLTLKLDYVVLDPETDGLGEERREDSTTQYDEHTSQFWFRQGTSSMHVEYVRWFCGGRVCATMNTELPAAEE